MKIHILGVPMDLGAGRRGVDMGPSAIRIAGVAEKLRTLGHVVTDEGDIPIKPPELQKIRNDKLRYLPEIVRACTLLSGKIDKVLSAGGFPLVCLLPETKNAHGCYVDRCARGSEYP